MNKLRALAVVLVIAGALALAYGGFNYTTTTHRADVGPIHVAFEERRRVNIPLWAGLIAVAAGVLMFAGLRKE